MSFKRAPFNSARCSIISTVRLFADSWKPRNGCGFSSAVFNYARFAAEGRVDRLGRSGGRRGRTDAVVGMLCTRFVIRRRNDRKMKTLRALRDPLTAAGEEVLIERLDLRRANNIPRKRAVFCGRFILRTRHPSARESVFPLNRLECTAR